MLGTTGDGCADAHRLQLAHQHAAGLADEPLAVGAALIDHGLDLGVLARIERREGQVLELPLHRVDAQPMSQRRVDLERLLGLLQLLLLAEERQRAHVVQAIGQLDHDDANVLCHREDHLAVVLGLGLFARRKLDLRELGYALDEEPYLAPKLGLDLVGGRRRVFDDVVQQRADQHALGLSKLRADLRDAPRMKDEGLAALPQLPVMVNAGQFEGCCEPLCIGIGRILSDILDQLSEQIAMEFCSGCEGGSGHRLSDGIGRLQPTPQGRRRLGEAD